MLVLSIVLHDEAKQRIHPFTRLRRGEFSGDAVRRLVAKGLEENFGISDSLAENFVKSGTLGEALGDAFGDNTFSRGAYQTWAFLTKWDGLPAHFSVVEV